MTNQSRTEFELWYMTNAITTNETFRKEENGDYWNMGVQLFWECWQEAQRIIEKRLVETRLPWDEDW